MNAKSSLLALDLLIKHSRPFPSALKTDQEVSQTKETVKVDF